MSEHGNWPPALSADTQAVVLLCGRFSRDAAMPTPLTTEQYSRLAIWLQGQKMRPADLLEPEGEARLGAAQDRLAEAATALQLLRRGAAMALAVEQWSSRGLWLISRADASYPGRFKSRLGRTAPAVLYGVGDVAQLSRGGVAVVGSRDPSEAGIGVSRSLGTIAAEAGLQVVSGAAKGVDEEAMLAAIAEGGTATGVLAGDLSRLSLTRRFREGIAAGRLVLVTPYSPEARFTVGNAMGRNRLVYALSDWAIVVSASAEKGGTWAGATENLKRRWVPLFAYAGVDAADGNRRLLELGARPLQPVGLTASTLLATLRGATATSEPLGCGQPSLFAVAPTVRISAPTQAAYEAVPAAEPITTVAPDVGSAEGFWNHHVWPALAAAIGDGASDKEVTQRLGLEAGQARAWLRRATNEGKVRRQSRPVRYVVAPRADR